jgi:hypothetical protein
MSKQTDLLNLTDAITANGTALKVDTIQTAAGGVPTASDLGINVAGSVLQVVQGVNGAEAAFAGTGGACGASVTITPTSATSKILVLVNLDGITVSVDAAGYGRFILSRNSTSISFFGYPRNWASVDNSSGTTMSTTYLDSPATTSALTYSTSWAPMNGTVTLQINRDGASYSKSTITVMEVAG